MRLLRPLILCQLIFILAACAAKTGNEDASVSDMLSVEPTESLVANITVESTEGAVDPNAATAEAEAAPAAGEEAQVAAPEAAAEAEEETGVDTRFLLPALPATLGARDCVVWSGNVERDRDNVNYQAWGLVTQQLAERASYMDDQFKKMYPKKRRIETFRKASYTESLNYTATLRPKQVVTEKDKSGKRMLCATVEMNQQQLYTVRDRLIAMEGKLNAEDIEQLELAFDGRLREDEE